MSGVQTGIYRHFKGNLYKVTGVAIHTETSEEFVVYRALYGDYTLLVRPIAMFFDKVERAEYSGPRFILVNSF